MSTAKEYFKENRIKGDYLDEENVTEMMNGFNKLKMKEMFDDGKIETVFYKLSEVISTPSGEDITALDFDSFIEALKLIKSTK